MAEDVVSDLLKEMQKNPDYNLREKLGDKTRLELITEAMQP
jgi:hypothetical protein